MFTSSRYSYLFLRLGLAGVFLWLGVDKFLNTSHWLSVWLPAMTIPILDKVGLSSNTFIYAVGTFEVLVGLSLVFSVFAKFFSALAILFIIANLIASGLSSVMIKDIAFIGGFLAILFWPDNRKRF